MNDLTSLDLRTLESVIARLSVEDRAELERLAVEELSKPFIPNPGPQTEALLSDADILLFGGKAGGGKLLSVEEMIPTPTGWTRMGDIAVNDTIFDETGAQAKVMVVSSIREAKTYRLFFDDNSEVVCCADHLWRTFDAKQLGDLLTKTDGWRARRRENRPSRVSGNKSAKFTASLSARNSANAKGGGIPAGSVRTTQQIVDTLLTPRGRRNHAVQVAGPIDTPQADLPIDPYTLGAWLGDGTAASGGFTGIDPFIWQQIEAAGYVVTHGGAVEEKRHYIRGLVPHLRAAGVLSNKHVPPIYLRAHKDQRLALLQGLMDTDGHAALDGGSEFDNTNRRLIDAVYEIVASLGIKATIIEGVAKLYGRVIGPRWRVKFTTSEPVFRLPRKAARLKAETRRTAKFRYIVDAVEVDPVPMRCIAVDSPSRLYLATKSFIPTHNTALEVGCAALNHRDGMIFRREATQLDGLIKFSREVFAKVPGAEFNGTDKLWKWGDGRTLKFAGLPQPDDWRKHAGNARDYYAFDEAGEFLKEQVFSLAGWLRSTFPDQRCRIILGSNPPRGADGAWMLEEFAPWLDPLFPDPALPGELRWAIMVAGETEWVDGPGEYTRDDEVYTALSRTFIPASLANNPYYGDAYRAQLQNLPEPLRSQLLHGDFLAGRTDDEWQVIPSEWIRLAQARWPGEPKTPMRAIGADVAQGGIDNTVLAPLHDGNHFASLKRWPGIETPDGATVAGLVMKTRRDNAAMAIDTTGGWGGSTVEHLQTHNDTKVIKIVFSAAAEGIDKKTGLGYANLRAKMYWEFRNALDPESGENVMLPPGQKTAAQLAVSLWRPNAGNIQIESKEAIKKRLKVSPDDADAIVMAWYIRNRYAQQARAKKLTPPKAPPRSRGSTSWMGR